MPTRRAWALFMVALILYFLANQTQVGWVYLITDGLVALLGVAALYSWRMLKPIQGQRLLGHPAADGSKSPEALLKPIEVGLESAEPDLSPPTFHEDDLIEISLRFEHRGWRPALMVSGLEHCPLAPADDRRQSFFIPALFKGQTSHLTYQTVCDRRGLYHFDSLPLYSRGPFGLFRTRRTLSAPTSALIYPAYRPLKRLRAFEKSEWAERQTVRVGLGTQVIGTREYRPGDSLRQVHWRSTARAGRLVVKEFSDEDQPTLTVVLDLSTGSNVGEGKYSTFETAVRIAASLGYYAIRQKMPFYLAGSSKKWTPPATPLSWWAILTYLAKVENDGQEPLSHVLNSLTGTSYVVALISRPDETTFRALLTLPRRSRRALALFITPDGALFPLAAVSGLEVKAVSPYNWVEVLDRL